ncbi:MAG: caspase family protein, partial [Gemmataceae bacterium]
MKPHNTLARNTAIKIVAVALLLVSPIGMWASGVFKVKTKDGTIVLENVSADAEVVVDGETVIVNWAGGRKAAIRVRPGTRKIEVKQKGFTLFGEEVEIQDGKRRVLTVRVVPQPPKTPTRPGGNPFPRRALLISVHDYLYANPLQNGMHGANANNLIDALNLGLHIPLPQIAHLSDDAQKYRPRAPTKTVIEQTLTKFLDTSRPQDRIMVFFIGHSVELGDDVYLAPIEGELDRADTLIPLKWFYEQLAKCKARQKVLVLDINRFNRTFGQERPGGEEMGPKLDAMLKAPPPGVQVWSSCIAKQRSIASDDFPMGIFLDGLLSALRRGGNGRIQHVEDAIPLDRYVDRVNQMMKDELSKRKLEQVSRMTGKEANSGAAYDAKQAPAPDALTGLAPPPVGVKRNKMLVETVLDQIGAPSIGVTHDID